MPVMKSEQILAESSKSFEDAVQVAITRFDKTVRGLKSAYVNDMQCTIKGGKIDKYRVNLQVTFEVAEPKTTRKKK